MALNLGVAKIQKGIVAPEIDPKSFGTFEKKQAPGRSCSEVGLALAPGYLNRLNLLNRTIQLP